MRILNNKVTILLIILLDLYLFLYAMDVYGVVMPFPTDKVRGIIIGIIFLFTILDTLAYPFIDKLQLALIFYAFVIVIGLFLNGLFTINKAASDLFYPLIFFWAIRSFSNKSDHICLLVIRIQCVMLIVFFLLFIYGAYGLGLRNGMFLNSSYYIALLLPFALCIDNSSIKLLLVFLSFLPAVMSAKRGAFLVVVLGVVVYYMGNLKSIYLMANKAKIKKTMYTLVVLIVLLIYIKPSFGIGILNKLMSSIEDGGSGRVDIYISMIKLLSDNSFFELMIGHGSFTSSSYIGFSSHNDFLEMLWSYGMFGFISYITIIIYIFKITHQLKIKGSCYYGPCCAALVAFIICSMISQLVFVPTYVAFLIVFFALCKSRVKM